MSNQAYAESGGVPSKIADAVTTVVPAVGRGNGGFRLVVSAAPGSV